MAHNLGENISVLTLNAGTFTTAQNAGGTIAGVVNAGLYEQHLVAYFGTFCNHGTINVYGCTNSGGSSPVLLSSLPVGSADATYKMGWAGTQFTHIAACGTCETGGTWRGALVIISTGLRNAPAGTPNYVALGSALN